MVVQTGWLITEGPEGRVTGSDMLYAPPLERGVLKAQGKAYRFGFVFPQGTGRERVYREMVRESVLKGVGQDVGCCHVFCGERQPEARLDFLLGPTGAEGVVSAAVQDVLGETTRDAHEVKFAFSCLKESSQAAVDLLKNIKPGGGSGGGAAGVSGEQAYHGATYFPVECLQDFSSVVLKVLKSPSFLRHSAALSLLLAVTVRSRVSLRETTFCFLDLSSPQLHAYNVIDSIDRWRRLNAPEAGVPACLTYPIRTSGRVSILCSHPSGTFLPATLPLLQQLAQFSPPPPPSAASAAASTTAAVSPTPLATRSLYSPSGVAAAAASSGSPYRASERRSLSPRSGADYHLVSKLRRQLQEADVEISGYKRAVTEYENKVCDLEQTVAAAEQRRASDAALAARGATATAAGEAAADALRRELAVAEGEARSLEKQLYEQAKELENRNAEEATALTRRLQDADAEAAELRRQLTAERNDTDELQRRLSVAEAEARVREAELERLRQRLREVHVKAERGAEKELAARDVEADLQFERERLEREFDGRIRMREGHLQRQHELQLASEASAHKRALTDLEDTIAALQQQMELASSDHSQEISHLHQKLGQTEGILEQKTAEAARLKASIPEIRREETQQLRQHLEGQLAEQRQTFTAEKQRLEAQLEEALGTLADGADVTARQYEAAAAEHEAKVAEYVESIEQQRQDRAVLEERFKAEHDSLVEILQAERTQAEEFRLKQIEENATRESELAAETSRMRNELALAQAEALKSSRVYEAKELELQGLQHLAKETDEVRVRNAELERVLRESQHYGKMQQLRREVETANEVLECMRVRMVPSWCADWARLGRAKDLREHLLAKAEELTTRVRTGETVERDQRTREAIIVSEHEQQAHTLATQAQRIQVLEEKTAEQDIQLQTLTADHSKAAHELKEARKVIEGVGNMILLNELPSAGISSAAVDDAVAGAPPLGESWVPSVELEIWLTDTCRAIIHERNVHRNSDMDKTHVIEELQLKLNQLQSENEMVNQNVKEMTSQIIGCGGLTTPVKQPPVGTLLHARDAKDYISMGQEKDEDVVTASAAATAAAAVAAAVPHPGPAAPSAAAAAAAASQGSLSSPPLTARAPVVYDAVPAPGPALSALPRPVVMMSPAAMLPAATLPSHAPLRERAAAAAAAAGVGAFAVPLTASPTPVRVGPPTTPGVLPAPGPAGSVAPRMPYGGSPRHMAAPMPSPYGIGRSPYP
eukprot:Rhum_TRINITY_DN14013_c0_g2::Rhum_TRINITY_DN14013_c0_g2_i2::g.67479::m.67479